MKRFLLFALAVGAVSCGLGGAGDDCVTAHDCEVGLQCFGGKCVDGVLSCGVGMEEVDGVCRRPPALRCGSDTVERDGECVPEELDAGIDASG